MYSFPPCRQHEINFLNATNQRLDQEIERLNAQKVQNNRRLNEIQAGTAILPTENLSSIFEHALNQGSSLFTLGAVCSYWHQVIRSTPMLWTSPCILMQFTEAGVRTSKFDLLNLFLQQSRDLPITLKLLAGNATKKDPMATLPVGEFFKLAFRDHPTKLKELVCHDFPSSWWRSMRNNLQSTSFPNLRFLDLEINDLDPGIDETIPMANRTPFRLPSLTTLVLRAPQMLPNFPYEQLTHLKLEGVEILHCLRLLLRFKFTKLRSFSCENPNYTDVSVTSFGYATVTRHDLEELIWPRTYHPANMILFSLLRAPALRHLHLTSSETEEDHSLEEQYLRQLGNFLLSSHNLVSLRLHMVGMHRLGMSQVSIPKNLQKLHLDSDPFDGNLQWDVFRALNLSRSPQLFPFIRELVLVADNYSHHILCSPNVLPLFVDMLSSRRENPSQSREKSVGMECVRFSFIPRSNISIAKTLTGRDMGPHRQVLERLVQEGLRVELASSEGEVYEWA